MSKTSIALLVMFFIALTSLLVLNTAYSSNPVLNSFPKIFPTQAVVAENTLAITPNPVSVQPGKTTSLQIIIDSKGPKPTLIQMELAYDPATISHVTLLPGTFFQNPQVRLNTVNARNGRISYAVVPSEGQEDTTASNVVATLRITPRLNAARKETTLYFLPKTLVQTEESKKALKVAYGTKIMLTGKKDQSASPSAAIVPEVSNQLPTAF